MHGDLGQGQRERALRAFRSGKVDVLTATEVAARGLDVDDVTHVVNYECPDDEKTYVHRIGRTGRAGQAGVAVTFVDWRDMHRWKLINDALGLGQPEPEETYSTSEHLYTELDIPREATGTLPRAHARPGRPGGRGGGGHRRDRPDPLTARPARARLVGPRGLVRSRRYLRSRRRCRRRRVRSECVRRGAGRIDEEARQAASPRRRRRRTRAGREIGWPRTSRRKPRRKAS